ncbi:MAG: hypothetical protein FK730_06235 [Asgard group archaeon]|nr:hypothetical protein [Asgard group archaeon]
MKKTMRFFLIILAGLILTNSLIAQSAFNVTVGEVFTYEVVKSEQDITWGVDSGQGSGLMFGGNPFPVGITFTIEALTTSATSVQWEIDIDGNTATNTDTASKTADMALFLFLPYLYYGGIGSWDQAEVEMGPPLMLGFFFFEPVAFLSLFQNYHDTITGLTPMSYWSFDDVNANFDTSEDIAVFDWVFNTMYNDTGCNMLFHGTFYFKVAYDQTTGVLKGYDMDFDYSGHVGSNVLSLSVSQIIEQAGFNLGKNQFSPGLPGLTFLIAIPVLIGMGVFSLILKKRRY